MRSLFEKVWDRHVVRDEPQADSVEELAARYVDEIQRVQPHGPYFILGWSVGGQLAHAAAVALQNAGEEVAYLGIMDAGIVEPEFADALSEPTPTTVEAAPATDESGAVVDLLGGWRDLFDLGDEVTAGSADDVAAVIREQIASMGLLEEGQVDRIMASFAKSAEIAQAYQPSAYRGAVQVFTATADKDDPTVIADSWRPYVRGAIVNVDVDTHHLGMADAESLRIIGPEIQRGLEAAAQPTNIRRRTD